MNFVPRLTSRMAIILCHDVVVTALALLCSLYFTFPDGGLATRAGFLATLVPVFSLYAGIVFVLTGLYRPKWRFTSMPDLISIARASLILAITLLIADYVLVAPNIFGGYVLGKKAIAVYFVLQMFFLSAPRVAYRYFRHGRTRVQGARNEAVAALALGRTADVDVLLRAVESGAVQRLRILGILSPSDADQQQSVRGVNVIGRPSDLETVASRLEARERRSGELFSPPRRWSRKEQPESGLIVARRLGIATSHLPSLDGGRELRLSPVAPEDLLLRAGVRPDAAVLAGVVRGRSVLVTGGGGSIGSELCRRCRSGAARLMIVEHSESAPLRYRRGHRRAELPRDAVSQSVRRAGPPQRMFALFEGFRPDIVFHAAALKHVPVAGARLGRGGLDQRLRLDKRLPTRRGRGSLGVVVISTDKAVAPGFGAWAIDQAPLREVLPGPRPPCRRAEGDGTPRTRLINVRFGNVLASNGSVVPNFQADRSMAARSPCTHPEMVRYFMTIGEAV